MIKMKKQNHLKAFSFVLILLLFFKICTINENIKYNITIYPQEKAHTLNSHDENTKLPVLFNRKDINSEPQFDILKNDSVIISFHFLALLYSFIFIQTIFDIRKKIIELILRHLNGSSYKDSLYFS